MSALERVAASRSKRSAEVLVPSPKGTAKDDNPEELKQWAKRSLSYAKKLAARASNSQEGNRIREEMRAKLRQIAQEARLDGTVHVIDWDKRPYPIISGGVPELSDDDTEAAAAAVSKSAPVKAKLTAPSKPPPPPRSPKSHHSHTAASSNVDVAAAGIPPTFHPPSFSPPSFNTANTAVVPAETPSHAPPYGQYSNYPASSWDYSAHAPSAAPLQMVPTSVYLQQNYYEPTSVVSRPPPPSLAALASSRLTSSVSTSGSYGNAYDTYAIAAIPTQSFYAGDTTHTVVGTSTVMEKPYLRLQGHAVASEVRPLAVLQKALQFVIEKSKTVANPGNYLYSQLKGIRQDLSVQHIMEDPFVAIVYEYHARVALVYGDAAEFNACQSVIRRLHSKGFYVRPSSVPEFAAYRLLYLAMQPNIDFRFADLLSEMMAIVSPSFLSLPPQDSVDFDAFEVWRRSDVVAAVQQDKTLSSAMGLLGALLQEDWLEFTRLLDKSPRYIAYVSLLFASRQRQVRVYCGYLIFTSIVAVLCSLSPVTDHVSTLQRILTSVLISHRGGLPLKDLSALLVIGQPFYSKPMVDQADVAKVYIPPPPLVPEDLVARRRPTPAEEVAWSASVDAHPLLGHWYTRIGLQVRSGPNGLIVKSSESLAALSEFQKRITSGQYDLSDESGIVASSSLLSALESYHLNS